MNLILNNKLTKKPRVWVSLPQTVNKQRNFN